MFVWDGCHLMINRLLEILVFVSEGIRQHKACLTRILIVLE